MRTVLYTGVTSDLINRIEEHKTGKFEGFTKRYKVTFLVYYEIFSDIRDAITREKQIKTGSGKEKMELVNSMNPDWVDLYNELLR
ncbi:MAG: GIY-YIG nuclease family protein [Ignavibacteriales bacterium]|nr:GIY-YIG nuclease family protein [Ignavibacteriales bacterium]